MPYAADVYTFYLQSRQDYENGEINRYNQSAALFNSRFDQFRQHYTRQHLPLSRGNFSIRGEEKCPCSPF